MEPQARHEEKTSHRYADNESQSLRFQQQPPVFVSFSVSFFSSGGLTTCVYHQQSVSVYRHKFLYTYTGASPSLHNQLKLFKDSLFSYQNMRPPEIMRKSAPPMKSHKRARLEDNKLRLYLSTSFFLALTLLLLMGGCTNTQHARKGTKRKIFLWKVTRPSTTSTSPHFLYIYGTIHSSSLAYSGLDRAVRKVFEKADVLVVESNTESAKNISNMKAYIQKYGLYKKGETVRKSFTQTEYQNLMKRAKKLGYSPKKLAQMKPWMIALILSSTERSQRGQKSHLGKEALLAHIARKHKKDIRSLETVKAQLSLFAQLSPNMQKALLKEYTKPLYIPKERGINIEEIYFRGDLESIRLLHRGYTEQQSKEVQAFNKKLLDDRNVLMTKNIIKLFKDKKKTYFVAIGAAHLPGLKGILNLLVQQGFTLERVPSEGFIPTSAAQNKPWHTYKDTSHNISIKFPTPPAIRDITIHQKYGAIRRTVATLQFARFEMILAKWAFPNKLKESLRSNAFQQEVLNMWLKGWLKNTDGRLADIETVRFKGSTGYRVEIETKTAVQEGYLILHEGVLLQMFTTLVGTSFRGDPRKEWQKIFFQSLTLPQKPT